MSLSRRGFLGLLGTALATAVLDPELLVWRPGARTIFLPTPARVIAGAALRPGDVFVVAGRHAINPRTWAPVTYEGRPLLQHFCAIEPVRAGQEVLARGVTPAFVMESGSAEGWEYHWRSDDFNGQAIPPGDHLATPLGNGSHLNGRRHTRPLGARGFVYPPPDRRGEVLCGTDGRPLKGE